MAVCFLAGILPAAVAGHSPRPKPDAFAEFPTHRSRVGARTVTAPPTAAESSAVERKVGQPPATNATRFSARVAVQQSLGTPASATIELLAGRRTGYQFSGSGKQVAKLTVAFAVYDAV